MPRFAANLSMMFCEGPFLDRFAAAAKAGFCGVEFLFPYEYSREILAARLREYHLENVLFNLPPGDWTKGDRGTACVPGREEEFRAGVDKALAYAAALGTERLHAMAGIAPPDAHREACKATLIANLRYAANLCRPHGITLLLEALNTRDMPGFFINTQEEAHQICVAVGAPNMKMQMDCYHMQIVEGDISTKLRRYAPHCGHIQIAGVPDRHEPDCGELRYEYIFRLLDEIGYGGWIGCEYRPANNTADGLGWLRHFAASTRGSAHPEPLAAG